MNELTLIRIETALRGVLRRGIGDGRRVLLTGGTGTLGMALTGSLIAHGYEVTVLSRDAHRQAQHMLQYPKCRRVLADICDRDKMLEAVTGQDIVIHAAAQKRVDTGEEQVREFARVNIEGTRIVAECCQQAMIGRALFISSDKAVQPLNFYGLTKAVGERLWAHADNPITRFTTVRYGNVMGSNGSVLQLWRNRIKQGLPIIVREPDTTRFLMTLPDAVNMVLYALVQMEGGEIFVPRFTPAFGLHELARSVQPDEFQWLREPLGPREKRHERLLAPGECFEYVSDRYVRVLPGKAGDFDVPPGFCSEHTTRLSGKEVAALLEPA